MRVGGCVWVWGKDVGDGSFRGNGVGFLGDGGWVGGGCGWDGVCVGLRGFKGVLALVWKVWRGRSYV